MSESWKSATVGGRSGVSEYGSREEEASGLRARRDGGIAGSERAYGAWSALAVALHVDPAMLAAESLSGGSTSV